VECGEKRAVSGRTLRRGEKSRELQEHEGGRKRWKSGSSVRGEKGGKEQWREGEKGGKWQQHDGGRKRWEVAAV